jgi:hypothetical protein
MSRRQL